MGQGTEPFSLYVHIPYCIKKCPYCDFNVHVVSRIPEAAYSEALLAELEYYAGLGDWRGRSLKSIYFGGGTPSTFSPSGIARILERAAALFPFERDVEITLEANPGREDSKHYSGYRSCGVNRVSLGAQSFQPHLLDFLGRLHTAEETCEALRIVRQAGFENFNLDLISASPRQSMTDLTADLEKALSFEPPHLSAYSLTIEEGTAFHREYLAGRLTTLPEETEVAMAELIEETLSRAGLERYEISNYARPGRRSRHNLNYWEGGDYLGLGAGAHSFKRENGAGGLRWHNERNPGRYMEKVQRSGKAVAGEEKLDLWRAAGEFMFSGLRMIEGISVENFRRRFEISPEEFCPRIHDFLEEGLMEKRDGRLRLTRRGLLVADAIFVSFV